MKDQGRKENERSTATNGRLTEKVFRVQIYSQEFESDFPKESQSAQNLSQQSPAISQFTSKKYIISRLTYLVPRLQLFAMDAWCAPEETLESHPFDDVPDFFFDGRSTAKILPGSTNNQDAPTQPVPPLHGFWLDDFKQSSQCDQRRWMSIPSVTRSLPWLLNSAQYPVSPYLWPDGVLRRDR